MSPADRDAATLTDLRDALRKFAAEREWDQFHTPKNLAMAVSVEAAELLEHFQWLTDEQAKTLRGDQLLKVQEEIADVFLYLARLADKLGINMLAAASKKMELNANKYPVAKALGNMKKYTDF